MQTVTSDRLAIPCSGTALEGLPWGLGLLTLGQRLPLEQYVMKPPPSTEDTTAQVVKGWQRSASFLVQAHSCLSHSCCGLPSPLNSVPGLMSDFSTHLIGGRTQFVMLERSPVRVWLDFSRWFAESRQDRRHRTRVIHAVFCCVVAGEAATTISMCQLWMPNRW